MAERRMFSKAVIDSDAFIDLPASARLLYYDLAMRADDDGFINSPKKIMRMVGCGETDLTALISNGFVIYFKSGIVAIRHWKMQNYIQKDRYKATIYQDERKALDLQKNGVYIVVDSSKTQE